MLNRVAHGQSNVLSVCGSCMDARGSGAGELMDGAQRGTLEELATLGEWADKILVF